MAMEITEGKLCFMKTQAKCLFKISFVKLQTLPLPQNETVVRLFFLTCSSCLFQATSVAGLANGNAEQGFPKLTQSTQDCIPLVLQI